MKKSRSSSKPHKKIKKTLKLSLVLKRKASFRPIIEDDLGWLYAGYKFGVFPFEEELGPAEFKETFVQFTMGFEEVYSLLAPLCGDSKDAGELKMVGIVGTATSGHRMEPHALWMPWATPMNKLGAVVKFLQSMRKNYLVMIFSDSENKDFFTYLQTSGILHRVGVYEHYFGLNEKAWAFHTRGLEDVVFDG